MKFKITIVSIKLIAIASLSILGLASSGSITKIDAQNCNYVCGAANPLCCSGAFECAHVNFCRNPNSPEGYCYIANTCADGSRSCGACPSLQDPGSPNPGDPGPGCFYPGGLQFGTSAQRLPLNNATGLDPSIVQFEWSRITSPHSVYAGQDWGHVENSCVPQSRIYTVYISQADAGGTCSTNKNSYSPLTQKEYPATNAGNIASGGNDPLIVKEIFRNNILKYATSYCWYVKKENKVGLPLTTDIRKFTTEARPVLVSTRIINARNDAEVPTCGADISRIGKYSATSTTIQNPMDIEVTYRDPDSVGELSDVIIALIPTVRSNGQSTRIPETATQNRTIENRSIAARFGINNTVTTKNLSTLNLSSVYTPNTVTGDLNNNIDANATILSMGSATNITLTPNADGSRTIVAKFRVRFNDNFPNNNADPASLLYNYYNIYSTLTFTRTFTNINNGNVVTTPYSADLDQSTIMGIKYFLNTSKILYVDTTNPNPVITSTVNPDNSFNVVWRANDNLALEPNSGFKTSVHANIAGDALMEDYPSGSIINPVPTTEPATSNLNAYGFLSNGVNYNAVYRDQNSGVLSNSIFTLDIDDLSCNNGRIQHTVTGLPTPWVSVFNGNASIGGALIGSAIPPISPYTQLFGLEDTSDWSQPYTTAYAFLVGGSTLPASYISKKGLYANSYDDLSGQPPEGTSWYQYFLGKVQDSTTPLTTLGTTTITNPGAATSTQDMSGPLGQVTGTKRNFVVNGNLTINQRNNCDLRSIFVVSGTLNIHSDFQIKENATSGIYNGCLFVVQGNVAMTVNTPNTSRVKFPVDGEHATFGLFESSIFTDGDVTVDTTSATTRGTFIVGNIAARGSITSTTTFTGSTNLTKPSMLVYTDPRYIVTFMDELGKYSYSIREEGFTP